MFDSRKKEQKLILDIFCGWLIALPLLSLFADFILSFNTPTITDSSTWIVLDKSRENPALLLSLIKNFTEGPSLLLSLVGIPLTFFATIPILVMGLITQIRSRNWIWIILSFLPFFIPGLLAENFSILPPIYQSVFYGIAYILLYYFLHYRKYLSGEKELKDVPLWHSLFILLGIGFFFSASLR